MLKPINDIASWIYYILVIVNLVCYTFLWKRRNLQLFKYIALHSWVMFALNIITEESSKAHLHNLSVSHVYFLVQCLLLAGFYYQILDRSKQRKFIRSYVFYMLVILCINYIVMPEMMRKFNYLEIFLTHYLLTVCALMYSYNTQTEKQEFFHINIGILTFSIISCSMFLLGNIVYIETELAIGRYIMTIHLGALLFFQSMLVVQWTKIIRNKTLKHEASSH